MCDLVLPPPPAVIHFMGLGGISVSALAKTLLARGYRVSGCDVTPNRQTDELAARGALVRQGHDEAHLDGIDLLVISAAVKEHNPELAAARERGLPVATAADLLGLLLRGLRAIAVAGTHGKTTTSALVATILLDAGLDPTAFVGGEVPALGGNVRIGRGDWAVAEADEYDRRFLRLSPAVGVILNIEADHLDVYRDLDDVADAFARFAALLPADGALVACADDPRAMAVARRAPCHVVSYGLDHAADWSARDVILDAEGAHFTLHSPNADALHIDTLLSGRHNVSNAVAALVAAALAGVDVVRARETLARFEAPRRRQEVKGRAPGGALVVDDYGHHPSEARVTLEGLRARYPGKRLRVVFQPHTYTRTRATLGEMAPAFTGADDVAVTEVFAARESDTLGIGGRDVVAALTAAGVRASFTPTLDDAAAWLARDAGDDVVLVTMGAGDIWKAGEAICAR